MFQPQHRVGVAIGDKILDVGVVKHLFNGPVMQDKMHVFDKPVLNDFMALGHHAWSEVRMRLQELLSVNNAEIRGNPDLFSR